MPTGLMGDTNMPVPASEPSVVAGQVPYAFGMVAMESLSQIEQREQAREAATEANNQPVIQGLAGYVRECWSAAFNAKRTTGVEDRMLKAVRQRRGEYDPDILAEIRKSGGSEIYMMLSSNKCRSAAGWLRDVILGQKDEKPWTLRPTPMPDMPPAMQTSILQMAQTEAQQYQQTTGIQIGPQDMERVAGFIKDRVVANAKKRAKETCERMELKMEDQLVEGGFQTALGQFIEDIVTFPSAFIAGPVVRRKNTMKWSPDAQGGYQLVVEETLVMEWERVDPFMMYPMPHCTGIEDGGLFRRHKLTRSALDGMRDVPGYNKDAISTVLDEHGRGGLHEWFVIDSQKAAVEGKSQAMILANPDATIDALQYMGSVQGKFLIEWGMDETAIPDPMKEYQCDVWLIGSWVIKAALNEDPLGRKNIYKASYEEVPGAFWGNAVTDLCRDTQFQCNVAARAIANNMGLASGPQVAFNVDRLPPGEDLTQVYPWKTWQFTSDPYGNTAQRPIEFFAPPLVAGELMQIYTFFSNLADEHTGIPRYMAGDATGSGALRTSSGMSMLMGNASKGIKQVVANIDMYIFTPAIERLFYHNMRYSDDNTLKGDVKVVARGANSLVVKETQQQRTNEFLQLALTNPIVGSIVGEEAIARLLRLGVKQLDFDTDEIIPAPEVIRARLFQQGQEAAKQQKQMQDFQMAMSLAPSHEVEVQRGPDGEMMGMTILDKQPHVIPFPSPSIGAQGAQPGGKTPAQTMSGSGQITGGRPITDNFSPMRRV